MGKTPSRSGEMIHLRYEDDPYPMTWYVRGHVSDADALAEVQSNLDDETEEREEPRPLRVSRRCWARWHFAEPDAGETHRHELWPYKDKQRGAFPVTEVVDLNQEQAWLRERAEQRLRDEELLADLCQRYPEATKVENGPSGFVLVLPGLQDEVRVWRRNSRDNTTLVVHVSVRDRPVWNARYGGEEEV